MALDPFSCACTTRRLTLLKSHHSTFSRTNLSCSRLCVSHPTRCCRQCAPQQLSLSPSRLSPSRPSPPASLLELSRQLDVSTAPVVSLNQTHTTISQRATVSSYASRPMPSSWPCPTAMNVGVATPCHQRAACRATRSAAPPASDTPRTCVSQGS